MSKANILLVEDSKSQADITKQFLERNGYEVDWAIDGKSAIKKIKTGPVDIVLLDFALPDINGIEVCRWMKHDQDTRGIPIIMLTARGDTRDKVSGLEAGADDYLPKPYNEVELNARIYACLRTKALQDELREKNIELQGMLSQMETLAVTDALTGLFNRRYCENALETEFKRAVRFGTPLSCLMLDIDHFKMINDVYGHRAGDTVLKEVARILKSGRRAIDTVARWGGEEFIVLLPQTKKEGAIIVASQFMSTLSAHVFSGISDEHVTVSIGIACVPDPSIDTGEKLVNASDCALYEAKRKGRNRIESA